MFFLIIMNILHILIQHLGITLSDYHCNLHKEMAVMKTLSGFRPAALLMSLERPNNFGDDVSQVNNSNN